MNYSPQKKAAAATAHSKLILIGEHSVVYGQPAIALPFPVLEVESIVEPAEESIYIESELFSGWIDDMPHKLKGIALCIFRTLNEINQGKSGLKITVNSKIPIGRGLGSSAAIAVAIVRSLFAYFHVPLTKEKLMELVYVAEKYAHGNPSGIDMETVLRNEPIWFKKGEEISPIIIKKPFVVIVADTGRVGDTRSAVESIREKLEQSPENTMEAINLLGEYTLKAKDMLSTGDIKGLGALLNLAQTQLDMLGVSDDEINNLVNCARKAGALGAKLTGGGRGGCIIALTENRDQAAQICQHLKKEGAKSTWTMKVQENK